jgi:two-component system, OmpR family, KDP operon response regulator KdpE
MSRLPKILVVDDEPQIQRFLKPSLIASGYTALSALTGAEAMRAFAVSDPDAIILDLGLPDVDGKTIIEAIRRTSQVPIIVLSARDRESEKIEALDLGADDFVNKPFAIGELLARIRSALRRRASEPAPPLKVMETAGISIDLARHHVTKRGAAIHLTPKEFDLLVLLMRNPGKVLTQRSLLHEVWGPANVNDSQYLRVFIGQLRAKLEDNPADPALILTEPGVGYRFSDAF